MMVPFLGTLNIRCRIIIGIQKGTIILTTTRMRPEEGGDWSATFRGRSQVFVEALEEVLRGGKTYPWLPEYAGMEKKHGHCYNGFSGDYSMDPFLHSSRTKGKIMKLKGGSGT